MPRPTLCLNMIVKNEAGKITRALESITDHINSWVVVDTGSTDGTPEVITKFFHDRGIPGLMGAAPFENFSQARNVALMAARACPFEFDYVLLMDADMELKVIDPSWLDDVKGPSYDMPQRAGTLIYDNRRLVAKQTTGMYRGVTHEYLDVDSGGRADPSKVFFLDHADGSNRVDKFKRDIKLLKDGLKDEPANYRYFYYLAQSYRDAGKHEKAAKWYKKRVDAGGWDEERWSAQSNYAHSLKDMGDIPGFIRETIVAYNMRPARAETLFDLAKFHREKGENATSLLYSDAGMKIPPSNDGLFVNDYVYKSGCRDEFAICAFYLPHRKEEGFKVCNELSLEKSPYQMSREMARNNLFFYHQPLASSCPSFTWKPIKVTAPDGYVAMNPSIMKTDQDVLVGLVRTVNYKIDEHGRYLILGSDGTANDSNPIHTRTLLVEFDADLEITWQREVLLPADHPAPKFLPVIGFEDMRLFKNGGRMWTVSCVREMCEDGMPEQVVACIDFPRDTQNARLTRVSRMLREPRECQKNWMPIEDKDQPWLQRFMYRCGEVVDNTGTTVSKIEPEIDVGHLGGGSQLLPYGNGYIAIVHEARQKPGQPTRFYMHRFATFNADFSLNNLSRPFYFNEPGIEYAMGLAFHPKSDQTLIISYGFKDSEARLATVDRTEVSRFLVS